MNTGVVKLRHRWNRQMERITGYLGLFLVGAISWGCERLQRTPSPAASESHQG